jgi:hypothetical protein
MHRSLRPHTLAHFYHVALARFAKRVLFEDMEQSSATATHHRRCQNLYFYTSNTSNVTSIASKSASKQVTTWEMKVRFREGGERGEEVLVPCRRRQRDLFS